MGEFYGAAWVRQFGENGGSGWETWCKALADLSIEQIAAGVEMLFRNLPKYPPNLPQFKEMCHGDIEKSHGLDGRELEFAPMMNYVCFYPGFDGVDTRERLSPIRYWIYRNIDGFNWRQMACKEARVHFNRVYDQALKLAREGYEFPEMPIQIETEAQQRQRARNERKKDPEYMSKSKKAGKVALAEIRKMMGSNK